MSTMSRNLVLLAIASSAVSHSVSQGKSNYFTVAGGLTITRYSEGIHRYSAPGWGLGVGVARDMNEHAQVFAEGVYQRFPVDNERVYSSNPNTKALGYRIRGEASQVYEGSAGFRIGLIVSEIRPFVTIGGGIMLLQSGVISFEQINPNFIRTHEPELLVFFFLGFGVEFPVADFLSSSLSAELSTPMVKPGVAIPIKSRWYFRL